MYVTEIMDPWARLWTHARGHRPMVQAVASCMWPVRAMFTGAQVEETRCLKGVVIHGKVLYGDFVLTHFSILLPCQLKLPCSTLQDALITTAL